MVPIVTPDEMAEIDRAAQEPVDVLIARAGSAVAHAALRMLGHAYGSRVVIVAGKGNNGNDGRDAAAKLRGRGVRVRVLDAATVDPGTRLPGADLVIDAAYGTGFHGEYAAPDPGTAKVLSVDIPSGVSGLTGEASDGAVRADATVTFAALKPGLVLEPGRSLTGETTVADIGLDCSRATAHLVEARDLRAWLPVRARTAHKWQSAVWVIGGSPGMTGAPKLAARGAQRAGSGYVRFSTPGWVSEGPIETVGVPLDQQGWAEAVLRDVDRVRAVVVGPGLRHGEDVAAEVRTLLERAPCPVLVDGTGLSALGREWSASSDRVVLTPHDGEYEQLTGHRPGADRIGAARELAAASSAIVLLKGPTTVVAAPDGQAFVTTTGDARLATAGTGDVLSGIIGAFMAQGLDPARAAAAGAWVHGHASTLGPARGLVAGDIPELLPAAFEDLERLD